MKKVALFACILALALSASSQQSINNGIPTNLPGVFTFPAPPTGFDPIAASDDELASYGFPPRPDKNVAPKAYAAWERGMKASKERIVPELEVTNHFNGPNLGLRRTENTSYGTSHNWSAIVDTEYVNSFGAASFYYIGADYVVPLAEQAYGTCDGGWDDSSSWVGIDGYQSSDVFQVGTESDAFCAGGIKKTNYYAWYEWFPNPEVVISNFPVAGGDDMQVYVQATSATQGAVYIINLNTNQMTSMMISPPAGTKLIGNSAEWVVERPEVNGQLATLTNYISDYFSDGWAYTHADPPHDPGSSGALFVTMLDNNMNPISYPSLLGPNGILFVDEGSAR